MPEPDLDKTRVHNDDSTRVSPGSDKTRLASPAGKPDSQPSQSSRETFVLQERLGEGGFAEVFLAQDRRAGRKVALKLLRQGPARDPEIVRRFESAAERTRELQHQNIIAVYGYETVNGRPAIAMEYVEGSSLRRIMHQLPRREDRRREPLPVEQALDIALQLCDALIYAHDQGIVHRDVKPDNVLLDTNGVVKLGDFDIAKIAATTAITLEGSRLGTPYYMSPEQLRGQTDIDGRSDVYSVGAVLYEMLTGDLPAGILKHPSELNPDVPRRLGSVILKALAADRGARYATIRDLHDALTGSPRTKRAEDRVFHFRTGQAARTIAELVELCERDWESAHWHLSQGHFEQWLEVVNAALADEASTVLAAEPDSDLALEKLLHLLDPALPDPVLALSESVIGLGELAGSEVRRYELTVSNPSRGYLVGSASSDQPWLTLEPTEFRLKEGRLARLTISARAPSALEKHSGQVVLASNGGTVTVSVHLTTTLRLLFPEAGQSAGDVPELIALCQEHWTEATNLFYDGTIERWLGQGPMRFDLVARAQDLTRRYGRSSDQNERDMGLRAFRLACEPEECSTHEEPFRFRTGEEATAIPALVALCETHRSDAEWHLYEGHFATWLAVVDPVLVADAEVIRKTENDPHLGLERLLHLLVPDLPSPVLELAPKEVDLGSAAAGEQSAISITVRNAGRGYLAGTLTLPARAWVQFQYQPHPAEPSSTPVPAPPDRCPECGTPNRAGAQFCERCGYPLDYSTQMATIDHEESRDTSESGELAPAAQPESAVSATFGCLAGEAQSFVLAAHIPNNRGDHELNLCIESNGGSCVLPIRVRVERRLLFPAANLSVGSIQELAEASSRFWGEARSLWSDRQIRSWLHHGLRRFDLVSIADEITALQLPSADAELIRFLLEVDPTSQHLLPPLLHLGREEVNLGTALHKTNVRRLRIENAGGAPPDGLYVKNSPPWLHAAILRVDSAGAVVQLIGNASDLDRSGEREGRLVLECAGRFADVPLHPQVITVPVRMQVANGLKIGPRRIPYDGDVSVRQTLIPVRALWVAGIGLAALTVSTTVGVLLHKGAWIAPTFLVLWLASGLAWGRYALQYPSLGAIARDSVHWLSDALHLHTLPGRIAVWIRQLVARARAMRRP